MSTEGVRKQTTRKVSAKPKKIQDESVPVQIPALEPVDDAKKVEKKKSTRKPSPPKEVVAPAPVEHEEKAEQAVEEATVSDGGEKLSRKKKTYQQLVSELDSLNQLVEKYMGEQREAKIPGLNQFLKSLEKGLKKARYAAQKIGKSKGSAAGGNVQSGFQKPVRISEEVSKFTGWDVSEPRARVEVTNFVCDYIKKHNLQSPNDKRIILADAKLSHLLDYSHERDGDLTYATIQKLLAKHYTSLTVV